LFGGVRKPFSTRFFTWLHVPKTGGTWLHRILVAYAPPSWDAAKGEPAHVQLWELPAALEQWVQRPERLRLPVLASCRNPWDWYVSLYFFMEGHYRARTGGFLPAPAQWEAGPRAWASDYSRGPGVEGFRAALPRIVADMHLESRFGLTRPQSDYLRLGNGELGVTPVRYEGLRDNMVAAMEGLGVEVPSGMRAALRKLRPQNVSAHPPYRDCYTPELRGLVETHERWLIETMKYSF